jgi:hypothetical protein
MFVVVRRMFYKKTPGEHADPIEHGLGPMPQVPIGPIFKRTVTVTCRVQFLEGPTL